MGLKTPKPVGGKVWLYILCFSSVIHVLTGALCIAFQVLLIMAVSPYHHVSSGLWSGPLFFVEGVTGLIACCDDLACTIVWLLGFTIAGILLAFAVACVAAVDLGVLLRCPSGDVAQDAFIPPFCFEPKYSKVYIGDTGQLIAAGLHMLASFGVLYYCCRYVYSRKPRSAASRRSSLAYEAVSTNEFALKPALSRTSLSGDCSESMALGWTSGSCFVVRS
ncbi:uncharacterized protein LOC136036515 isoform X2 [Artemia franciscana]|uniref:uncharacterized protein LOC136036515 isoform X2 n=1 Tax=Artemia franciscana TaxID=6661 RepID=UPI0032DB6A10